MHSSPQRVTDDAGVEFVIGQKIASGKQGTVYRVDGHPELAIKLLENRADLDRIASVRRLPLDGLDVAAPLTLIRNGGSGYLMRLASDMAPIREPYLPRVFGASETNASWYLSTGGLRRRLAILASIAQTLAALHERGLAYVDLNPNNVMISDDLRRTETWLIDTDNLTSRGTPDWDLLGFPGYAAPERAVHHAPPSTLADAYILAIHVFRMLILCHPLEGEAAEILDGDTARTRMDRGDLPYVGDPHDQSNALPPKSFHAGIYPTALSGRLRALSERTFTEGRLDPTKRPGSAQWRNVLYSALDNVVICAGDCGWTYYRLESECRRCGAPTPPSTLITAHSGTLEHPLSARDSFVARPDEATTVLRRHLWGTYEQRDPVLTLRPVRGAFEVSAHDDAQVLDNAGKTVKTVPVPAAGQVEQLMVQSPQRPARILKIRSVAPK